MKPLLKTLITTLDKVVVLCGLPGRIVAWLMLLIIFLSIVSVIAGLFSVHQFMQWDNPVFLLGSEINSTSLVEMQWHLFAVVMLFAGSFTYSKDRHVRVDVFYSRMPEWLKLTVNIVGDLFFLLPFCLFTIYYSSTLVQFSYQIAETSSEMGLTHRWAVKSVLPAAMVLLSVQALCHGLAGVLRLVCLGFGVPIEAVAGQEKEDKHER